MRASMSLHVRTQEATSRHQSGAPSTGWPSHSTDRPGGAWMRVTSAPLPRRNRYHMMRGHAVR